MKLTAALVATIAVVAAVAYYNGQEEVPPQEEEWEVIPPWHANNYIATSAPNNGWMMFTPGMVFEPEFTARDLFTVQNGWNDMLLVVTTMDPQTKLYQSYVRGDDEDENFPLYAGYGYWVWTSRSVKAFEWGPMNSTINVSVPLYHGWNIVGKAYPALREMRASQFMSWYVKDCTPVVMAGYRSDGTWYSYVVGDSLIYDFWIHPSRGYYLWVSGNGTLAFS